MLIDFIERTTKKIVIFIQLAKAVELLNSIEPVYYYLISKSGDIEEPS